MSRKEVVADSIDLEVAVKELLVRTKEGIANGDRDAALASIVSAISLTRGPDMILSTLQTAKDRARDELEMQRKIELAYNNALVDMVEENSSKLIGDDSILKDRDDGSVEILRDAFEDGSSVICIKCSALVKANRWEAHRDMWCPMLADEEKSHMEIHDFQDI
jgi:hypothetical protein